MTHNWNVNMYEYSLQRDRKTRGRGLVIYVKKLSQFCHKVSSLSKGTGGSVFSITGITYRLKVGHLKEVYKSS